MNKPLAFLIAGIAASSVVHANAMPYSPADAKARQQMAQSTTEAAVATSGGRATAWQDARNFAISSRIARPTTAERHADVMHAAVYPQSGPSMAALAAKNTAMSRAVPRQTENLGAPAVERAMEEASTP